MTPPSAHVSRQQTKNNNNNNSVHHQQSTPQPASRHAAPAASQPAELADSAIAIVAGQMRRQRPLMTLPPGQAFRIAALTRQR